MDSGAYPDLEDDGSKEKNSVEYRPETEANRGCDSAKGFQYGVVARLSDLSLLLQQLASRAPLCAGLFILSTEL